MPKPETKIEQLAAELKRVSEELAGEQPGQLTARRAKDLRTTVWEAHQRLRAVFEKLDPIRHPDFVFDPSNPNVAGRIVGITLVAQDRKPLSNLEAFYGSGVYALYYNGDFEPYASISGKEHPLYVGKADPAIPTAKSAIDQGNRLYVRLNDHCRTIGKAKSTLKLEDFDFRALVVQSGWESAAENYLIHLFQPIWNNEIDICYGFGKHGDNTDTRANLRSPWDTMHPGREWAHRDPNIKDKRLHDRILTDIAAHLEAHPPLGSIEEILRQFLDEMREVS